MDARKTYAVGLPILLCVAVSAYAENDSAGDARSPEEVIQYLVESQDCELGSPRLQPLYALIRQAPDRYETAIRRRLTIPEGGIVRSAGARDRLERGVALIHLLGPRNGTRLAMEVYADAADREEG